MVDDATLRRLGALLVGMDALPTAFSGLAPSAEGADPLLHARRLPLQSDEVRRLEAALLELHEPGRLLLAAALADKAFRASFPAWVAAGFAKEAAPKPEALGKYFRGLEAFGSPLACRVLEAFRAQKRHGKEPIPGALLAIAGAIGDVESRPWKRSVKRAQDADAALRAVVEGHVTLANRETRGELDADRIEAKLAPLRVGPAYAIPRAWHGPIAKALSRARKERKRLGLRGRLSVEAIAQGLLSGETDAEAKAAAKRYSGMLKKRKQRAK